MLYLVNLKLKYIINDKKTYIIYFISLFLTIGIVCYVLSGYYSHYKAISFDTTLLDRSNVLEVYQYGLDDEDIIQKEDLPQIVNDIDNLQRIDMTYMTSDFLATYNNKALLDIQIFAVPNSYIKMFNPDALVAGNYNVSGNNCVITKQLVIDRNIKINDKIEVNGKNYIVSGIVDRPDNQKRFIYINIDIIDNIISGYYKYYFTYENENINKDNLDLYLRENYAKYQIVDKHDFEQSKNHYKFIGFKQQFGISLFILLFCLLNLFNNERALYSREKKYFCILRSCGASNKKIFISQILTTLIITFVCSVLALIVVYLYTLIDSNAFSLVDFVFAIIFTAFSCAFFTIYSLISKLNIFRLDIINGLK